MANKLYEENDIAAIATAIRAKNGSSNTYTVSQMAPAINALSFDITNSIIRQYKATTNTISARTFVEFVNKPVITKPVQNGAVMACMASWLGAIYMSAEVVVLMPDGSFMFQASQQ